MQSHGCRKKPPTRSSGYARWCALPLRTRRQTGGWCRPHGWLRWHRLPRPRASPGRARSGSLHPAPYTLHPTPHSLLPTPCTLNHAPYTLHPTSFTPLPTPFSLHPTPYTLHPTSFTLLPTPYTIHPPPYALHPTLYTPHPTPFTLHPTPCTLNVRAVGSSRWRCWGSQRRCS